MPKKPTDYSRTVIYKIEHKENKELVYVGSTTDFTKRKCSHKSHCYNEKGKSYNLKLYVMIRENGGFDAFQMLEIKKFPCNDKREAEAEEERCRMELKANMNTQRAFVIKSEYMQEFSKRRITCVCGSIYAINHKDRHYATKKHQDNIDVLTDKS